ALREGPRVPPALAAVGFAILVVGSHRAARLCEVGIVVADPEANDPVVPGPVAPGVLPDHEALALQHPLEVAEILFEAGSEDAAAVVTEGVGAVGGGGGFGHAIAPSRTRRMRSTPNFLA